MALNSREIDLGEKAISRLRERVARLKEATPKCSELCHALHYVLLRHNATPRCYGMPEHFDSSLVYVDDASQTTEKGPELRPAGERRR